MLSMKPAKPQGSSVLARAKLNTTSAAVNGVPSWKRTFGRSSDSQAVGSTSRHVTASCGTRSRLESSWINCSTPRVEKAYERFLDGAFLRQGQARGSFEYAGILFEEYRGRVGTVDFTDASKGYLFPVGVPGLFRQSVFGFVGSAARAPADFALTVA
jgi:Phage major capsid protein E